MRTSLAILIALLIRLTFTHGMVQAQEPEATGIQRPQVVRFEAVHVFIDSGNTPLSAYQFKLSDSQDRVQIVGVENGEHAAFGDAPFYDRETIGRLNADHVIVAGYSTLEAAKLPTGKTRIATVHLRVPGTAKVDYQLQLIAAADADGKNIQATLSHQTGSEP
jgi:hypothetical protein